MPGVNMVKHLLIKASQLSGLLAVTFMIIIKSAANLKDAFHYIVSRENYHEQIHQYKNN